MEEEVISDYYYCEKCGVVDWENVNFCGLDYFGPATDSFCEKCEGEVFPIMSCPVHGVDAIDAGGDCGKC